MAERRGRPPKTFTAALEKYRGKPVLWLEDTFGIKLWKKQESIINSVWNNRYTAVKSCYASGKSYLSATLVEAFHHLFLDSLVITTAPSYRQLNNIWGVIHELHEQAKAPLGSKLLTLELRGGANHKALGFTTNMPERLQGMHKPKVLIIEDESAGIDREIHDRLDALMTGENCHFLAIGNPLSPEGHFFDMFQERSKYKTFTISAFDTPNLKLGKEAIPGLVTKIWVDEKREELGEDSPWWISQVLGEFPPEGSDLLIPLTWIVKAQQRWETVEPTGPDVYGLDPSGGGLDEAVLITRNGDYVHQPKSWQALSSPALARNVDALTNAESPIYIDSVGVGYGVHGILVEKDKNAVDVIAQSSPIETDTQSTNIVNKDESRADSPKKRFLNLRAQLYWELRNSLDYHKGGKLALPPDNKLASELSKLKYEINVKGKIKIESKKDMKKRGLSSPNRADALMLTMMDNINESMPAMSVGYEEDGSYFNALNKYNEMNYVTWDNYFS